MLGDNTGNKIDKYVNKYVVFDLETTGISLKKDKIVEISAMKIENGEVVEIFTSLVNPKRVNTAANINGISDEILQDQPTIDEVLPKFIEFIGDDILMGHNIQGFDLKFIYRDCMELFGKVPSNDYVDSLLIARRVLPEMAHRNLEVLAKHYGLNADGAHRALNDCRMNFKVFEFLKDEINLFESGKKQDVICPECGKKLVLRMGKYGEFWGCTKYPKCKFTMQRDAYNLDS